MVEGFPPAWGEGLEAFEAIAYVSGREFFTGGANLL